MSNVQNSQSGVPRPPSPAKLPSPSPQIDPRNIIKVDPGTLLAIIVGVLFVPLLLAGLFSH